MMNAEEVFVSTDIEANGPIPGRNSMLSFGSAAFTLSKGLIGRFSANLEELAESSPDPSTMTEFWDKNPEAWAACRESPRPIGKTMGEYVGWLRQLPGKPVFVGYPAGFDFTFVYWYIRAHGYESPFSFSALDIKTYVMAYLGIPYRESTKRNMPKEWFPKNRPHTHVALDDAIEQGELFMNIMKARLASRMLTATQIAKVTALLAKNSDTLSAVRAEFDDLFNQDQSA